MAPRARILVIDDQLYFRSFLEGLLAEEGFTVATAEGAVQAAEHLAGQEPFDLVIVDPAATGREAVRVVSELRLQAPATAVLILAGAADVDTVAGTIRAGASEYLLKPVERDRLLEALRAALDRRARHSHSERLVDENLEFMGRLSLHERALPLLARPSLEDAARGVLDLLAVEAGAIQGALWLRSGEGEMRLAVTRSVDLPSDATWRTGDGERDGQIAAGQIVQMPGPGGSSAAIVPILHEGEELAVARLVSTHSFPASSLDLTLKLAGVILANAVRVDRLARAALVDPLTSLPTRGYLERVLDVEVHKAQRFGRRLACLCLELKSRDEIPPHVLSLVVGAIRRTLRTTDILCGEGPQRFWVLVTDTDSLGGVVLKRRLAERVAETLQAEGAAASLVLGVASYPLDGETPAALLEGAMGRVATEHVSVTHELGIEPTSSLGDISRRLLGNAMPTPANLVSEAAELLIGELTCRPGDRGLLFVAPGPEAHAVLGPLAALGDAETATEVFIATDSDTLPSGASVTAVALPSHFDPDDTWMVRFGEAPAYALVAGPSRSDGTRPVFQTLDPVLVEHIAFRLRAEVGFGARA